MDVPASEGARAGPRKAARSGGRTRDPVGDSDLAGMRSMCFPPDCSRLRNHHSTGLHTGYTSTCLTLYARDRCDGKAQSSGCVRWPSPSLDSDEPAAILTALKEERHARTPGRLVSQPESGVDHRGQCKRACEVVTWRPYVVDRADRPTRPSPPTGAARSAGPCHWATWGAARQIRHCADTHARTSATSPIHQARRLTLRRTPGPA